MGRYCPRQPEQQNSNVRGRLEQAERGQLEERDEAEKERSEWRRRSLWMLHSVLNTASAVSDGSRVCLAENPTFAED